MRAVGGGGGGGNSALSPPPPPNGPLMHSPSALRLEPPHPYVVFWGGGSRPGLTQGLFIGKEKWGGKIRRA